MSDDLKNNSPTPDNKNSGERSTVSMWVFALTLMLIYLGAVYFDHHSGWFNSQVYAPFKDADELEAYQPVSGEAALLALGKQKYDINCAICHGTDGMGKPNQAPPLAGSEWVNAKGDNRLIHIPLEGLNGTIEVKGQQMSFPAGMVAIGQALSDSDIAAALTYIRSSWGNSAPSVTPDDVKAVRAEAAGHPPIDGEQGLKAIKE